MANEWICHSFFHFILCWPRAGDILQPANKRFTNPSVIVSVTERCQAKDKTRLGAKKTKRRHVPCDLNLSRRKRIWNGKKKERPNQHQSQKRKRTIWQENTKKCKRKGCASLIIAAFASPVVCFFHLPNAYNRIRACPTELGTVVFSYPASLPPTCQMLRHNFVLFKFSGLNLTDA